MKTPDLFHRFSIACSQAVGSSRTFVLALGVIALSAAAGPMFAYSDTWQLLINTGTTIITFLMVFLIQNAQNRDAEATQLKLDELILALKGARKSMLDVEDLSDEELTRLKMEFARMGDHPDDPVRRRLKKNLGRGGYGGQGGHAHATPGLVQAPADAMRPAVAAPRRKQRQFEEYTQPLRVSQRQWS